MNTRRQFLEAAALAAGAAGMSRKLGADQLPPGMTTDWGDAGDRNEIHVGSEAQLFCDDFLLSIGSAAGLDYPINVQFNVARAEKDSVPVMLPGVDAPWEKTGMYWVNVLHDGGRYRCWYNSTLYAPRRPEYPHQRAIDDKQVVHMMVSYAESDDGVHWRKPKLNVVEVEGSKEHNICFLGDTDRYTEGCSVFLDPSGRPDERYKMVYAGRFGLRGAASPDGLNWKQLPGIFETRGLDTQNIAHYDPVLGRYVAYIRSNSLRYGGLGVGEHRVAPARRGRAVARLESSDFRNWSPAEIVLAPDIDDGLDCDFYNCPASRYGNMHFMLFSPYYHWSGKLNLQVAVSRDNRSWVRPTRGTIVENGPAGSYDEYRIYAGPGIVPAGRDRIAIYTRTGQGPHPGSVERKYEPGTWKTWKGLPEGAMGRVTFLRDRIIGLEAGNQQGNFATRPLLFTGNRLLLNAEPLGPQAELRVQLVTGEGRDTKPVPGRTFADSLNIAGDALDAVARWTDGTDLSAWSGKPVRLHFHMKSMRLYAIRFTG